MFDVFKRHRKLKLAGIAFGLLLAWYAAKPAIDMANGQNVDPESLIGSYANTSEHQVMIYDGEVGRLISENTFEDFFYNYIQGVLECRSLYFDFKIRVLGDGSLFNGYDNTYLYRRAEA